MGAAEGTCTRSCTLPPLPYKLHAHFTSTPLHSPLLIRSLPAVACGHLYTLPPLRCTLARSSAPFLYTLLARFSCTHLDSLPTHDLHILPSLICILLVFTCIIYLHCALTSIPVYYVHSLTHTSCTPSTLTGTFLHAPAHLYSTCIRSAHSPVHRSVCSTCGHSPAQTPQSEAEATVGVEADGDLPGGVQLALQLYGAAQGTGGCV